MSSDGEEGGQVFKPLRNVCQTPASSSVPQQGSAENLEDLYANPRSNDQNERKVTDETSGSSGGGRKGPKKGKCQEYKGTLCNILSGVGNYVKESICGVKKPEVAPFESNKDDKQRKNDSVSSENSTKGWIKSGDHPTPSYLIKANGTEVSVSGFKGIRKGQSSPSTLFAYFPQQQSSHSGSGGHLITISAEGTSKVEIKYKILSASGPRVFHHSVSRGLSHKPKEETSKKKHGRRSRSKRSDSRTSSSKTRSRSIGRNTKSKAKKRSSRNKSRKIRPKSKRTSRKRQARPKKCRRTSRSSSPCYGSSDSDSDDDDHKDSGRRS